LTGPDRPAIKQKETFRFRTHVVPQEIRMARNSPASPSQPSLHVVRIETTAGFADTAEAVVRERGHAPARWDEEDRPLSRIDIFFDSARAAAACAEELAGALPLPPAADACRLSSFVLPGQDWQNSWKQYFHTARVSDRVVIRPSWEPYTPAPGDCDILLDPGMSFGTGQHGTTRGCLQWIDRLAPQRPAGSLLDLGCGSGVLAIAAAKLGYAPVVAMDNDPLAIGTAEKNAARNRVADRVAFARQDVFKLHLDRTYDVVVANILAEVLIAASVPIARAVSPAPAARLILSGILAEQYTDVCGHFGSAGFGECGQVEIDGWTTGCFARS
jgi:ribosomal protein L11 methyltransferase